VKNKKILMGVLGASLVATASVSAYAVSVSSDVEGESYTNSTDGENAILVDGDTVKLDNITVNKTGDSSGDDADFYGENAAILATNGANLTITDSKVTTNGAHANGVFSYGEGTVVNVSDTTITTSSNNSGGIMTTGGATMNASNLTITTSGGSSAAIRSDRGGGDVNVEGGTYSTSGSGSPAIYSTADISVSNATLKATTSEAVVVEGGNSVSLTNVSATGNNTKNSQSDEYKNVLIYQSMSGDASEGTSSFTMTGGSMTSNNGHMFFVTNTTCTINLSDVDFTYADGDFLRAAADAWGSSGSNGGNVTLNATSQDIDGAITVDSVSSLNMYLADGSSYDGAINTSSEQGSVYVSLDDDSTWSLTGDSYITSLTCDEDAIELNDYNLYVNGVLYEEGTASTGSSVEGSSYELSSNTYTGTITEISEDSITLEVSGMPGGGMPSGEAPDMENGSGSGSSSEDGMGMPPGDMPSGEKPSGEMPSGEKPSGEMPSGEKPSGQMPSGEKPSDIPSDGASFDASDMPEMNGQMPSGEMPSGDMESKSVTFETAEDYTDDFEVGDMVTITLEDGVVVSIEAAATNQ